MIHATPVVRGRLTSHHDRKTELSPLLTLAEPIGRKQQRGRARGARGHARTVRAVNATLASVTTLARSALRPLALGLRHADRSERDGQRWL